MHANASVRHAETTYNLLGICNADPEVHVGLSENGLRQAGDLAAQLAEVKIDALYASELPRTQQTAAIINKHHGLPIRIDPRINENRTGFEGRPVIEWRMAHAASGDFWGFRHGDGETLTEVDERIRKFLGDVSTSGAEQPLVVTHQIGARFIMRAADAEPRELWEYPVVQGGYHIVEL